MTKLSAEEMHLVLRETIYCISFMWT